MRRTVLTCLFAAGVLLACSSVRAGLLENFDFDDDDNTALEDAANSVNAANQWVHDTDHVSTIQVLDGSLNIVKNDTNFVTEGLGMADVNSGVIWMVAEFKNWAVLGAAPDTSNEEEIRFGFMGTEDLVPPPSSTVLAEMMIARDFDAGQFQISATALGAAGTALAPASINFVQNDPFIMAMKVDQDANTYTVFYQDGANPLANLGTGNLEPTRDALVTRMTINNFWGDESGEFANLDRFYISDMPPAGIPEPTSCMLCALAAVGLLAARIRAA